MSDPFAELFRMLRVRGVIYFAQDFCSPWGMALPALPNAQFHVALRGSCRVEWAAGSALLDEHEVLLFPNGASHTVSDGAGGQFKAGREVAQAIRRGEAPFPGHVSNVRLLSGHFEFDRAARHPLLRDLPDIVHARTDGFDAPLYTALEPLMAVEAAARRPGAETIMERLAEIFLIQLLRAHFGRAETRPGLLGAMFDPRLGAGIAAIHRRWAEPLTLADIAAASGMSRSAFASAFKLTTGVTPMAYLAQWRLLKGRELLADRSRSVAQVAAACGHRSTEGFSRAFRRVYGQSPSASRSVQERGVSTQ